MSKVVPKSTVTRVPVNLAEPRPAMLTSGARNMTFLVVIAGLPATATVPVMEKD